MSEGRITATTLIPAGIVVAAIGLTAWVTWMTAGAVGRVGTVEQEQATSRRRTDIIESKIDAMAKDVADVATTLRERSLDFVTTSRIRAWRHKLAHDNPSLLIPEWDE